MGRRSSKRPWGQEHRPLDMGRLASVPRTELGPEGAPYQVRRVRGGTKDYVCPGCLHTVAAGVAHVVAWPEEAPFGMPQGLDGRRHWHSDCWDRRLRPR